MPFLMPAQTGMVGIEMIGMFLVGLEMQHAVQLVGNINDRALNEAEREKHQPADEDNTADRKQGGPGSCLGRTEPNSAQDDTDGGNRNADADDDCTHKETPPSRFAVGFFYATLRPARTLRKLCGAPARSKRHSLGDNDRKRHFPHSIGSHFVASDTFGCR
ncbi:hypothetical protein MKI84_12765 [Ancylobacter sp. A5.8]|uniref:hypothetical protein n=1 Tax=Ancylobacter gelatini TaxID=2919920 RepID=UPI001F4EEAF4|nr:hypothetical protein [Ancylobacter gelatini]MCJ8143788.1 hypothetical protein [Ancylobacter gelatini]